MVDLGGGPGWQVVFSVVVWQGGEMGLGADMVWWGREYAELM